jgi:phage tail sheath protein FI
MDGTRPPASGVAKPGQDPWGDNSPPTNVTVAGADKASDGGWLDVNDFTGTGKESGKEGLYSLLKADLFNLLCIPPYLASGDVDAGLVSTAAQFCEDHRAFLLVDPPTSWTTKDAAKAGVASIGTNSKNAAVFFPRLTEPDTLRGNQLVDVVPCGAVAGVFARTDTNRGVWKAPAGTEATLVGVPALSVPLTDAENGELNPLGINCLRTMPAAGRVVWGSRTLQGDDRLASEWKYVPVRRTALFIEESLYRGTQWVVFEPNDEPLWAQIRLNIGAFMQNLFRQGAFQGRTPAEAYFVRCDKETTTQNDIDLGIVNIVVGFAPLKPAEFVVIGIQQIAGQIQA